MIHFFNVFVYLKVIYYVKFTVYIREFIEFYLKLIYLVRSFIINDIIKLFVFFYKILKEGYRVSFGLYGFYCDQIDSFQ